MRLEITVAGGEDSRTETGNLTTVSDARRREKAEELAVTERTHRGVGTIGATKRGLGLEVVQRRCVQ